MILSVQSTSWAPASLWANATVYFQEKNRHYSILEEAHILSCHILHDSSALRKAFGLFCPTEKVQECWSDSHQLWRRHSIRCTPGSVPGESTPSTPHELTLFLVSCPPSTQERKSRIISVVFVEKEFWLMACAHWNKTVLSGPFNNYNLEL